MALKFHEMESGLCWAAPSLRAEEGTRWVGGLGGVIKGFYL